MSNIDPSKPTEGQATTQSVRDNFSAAADEIDANAADIATNAAAIATIEGGSVFDAKLAGYLNTGYHTNYADDLDAIAGNSVYQFSSLAVTNAPTDMVGSGVISTEYLGGVNSARQVIWGGDNNAPYSQWQRVKATAVWGDWKLVVDGGAMTQRLPGYADTGLSETYTGDLNDIIVNSKFDILGSDVTNEPSDFVASRRGWVMTMMNPTVTTFATQVIYGNNNENQYKMWMRTKDVGVWAAWKLVVNQNSARGAATAWASVAITGAISSGYNVASVTPVSAGIYDVVFETAMANNGYAVTVAGNPESGTARNFSCGWRSKTVNGFQLVNEDSNGLAVDAAMDFIVMGP